MKRGMSDLSMYRDMSEPKRRPQRLRALELAATTRWALPSDRVHTSPSSPARRNHLYPTAMEARWKESRAQRMHLQGWRQVRGVAKVVGVFSARQRGAGGGFGGNDANFPAATQLLADEGKGEAREVRTASGAADNDVRLGSEALHLLDRLDADHRLMHQDMVQNAAQSIFGVIMGCSDLDGFGQCEVCRVRAMAQGIEHEHVEAGE